MWGFPTARVNSIFVAVTKHNKQNGGQEESLLLSSVIDCCYFTYDLLDNASDL